MTDTNDSAKGTPSVVPGAEPILVLKSLVAAVDPNDQLSLLKLMRWFKEIPSTVPPETRPMLDEARLLVLRMTGNDRTPEKTLADLGALVDRVVKSVETKAAPPPAAAPPAPAAVVSPKKKPRRTRTDFFLWILFRKPGNTCKRRNRRCSHWRKPRRTPTPSIRCSAPSIP
jgi:hypothetical protein